jgi:hypothetical protein
MNVYMVRNIETGLWAKNRGNSKHSKGGRWVEQRQCTKFNERSHAVSWIKTNRYKNCELVEYILVDTFHGRTGKDWEKFQESGMLFLTNKILMTFGWSLVMLTDGTDEQNAHTVMPVRTNNRVFADEIEEEGLERLYNFLERSAAQLKIEGLDKVQKVDV